VTDAGVTLTTAGLAFTAEWTFTANTRPITYVFEFEDYTGTPAGAPPVPTRAAVGVGTTNVPGPTTPFGTSFAGVNSDGIPGTWEFDATSWVIAPTTLTEPFTMPNEDVTFTGTWNFTADTGDITYGFTFVDEYGNPYTGAGTFDPNPTARNDVTVGTVHPTATPNATLSGTLGGVPGTWIFGGWYVGTTPVTDAGVTLTTAGLAFIAEWTFVESIFEVTYTVTDPRPATYAGMPTPSELLAEGTLDVAVAAFPTTTETTNAAGQTGTWTFNGWTQTGLTGEAVRAPGSTFEMPGNNVAFTGTWTFTAAGGGGGGGGGGGPIVTPQPDLTRQAFLIGRPSGNIYPHDNITRGEVATIFFRLIEDDVRTSYWTQANQFGDVQINNWFNNAVSTTTNLGLFRGVSEDRFAPRDYITRGELAAVLVRFMGLDRDQIGSFSAEDRFPDIADHWATDYVNEAARRGWIQGFPDGTFRPRQEITRAEAAAMVNRLFTRAVQTPADLHPDMVTWPDNQRTNAWYYLYIQLATNSFAYEWRVQDTFMNWLEIIEPRNWRVLERPTSRPEHIFQ